MKIFPDHDIHHGFFVYDVFSLFKDNELLLDSDK